MMAVLNKHLSRAMSMQHRFDKLEEALIQSSNVLDLIDFGLVLYGQDRTPVFVNAAARRILDAGDGMRLQKKGLVIGDREAKDQFEALIDAIYRSDQALSERSGGIVTIPRQSHARPYSLMVTPMQSRKTDLESVNAAVYLFDPSVRKTTAIEMFVSSYDLTRSEAELAHFLALGGTLEDVAERRGVSRNTAKTQLHSIFAKTETNRQSELVSLLLRSVAGINLRSG
jgi:DNA-binding CsgD family transcriptional regulator